MMRRVSFRLPALILGSCMVILTGCSSTPPARFFVLSPNPDLKEIRNPDDARCFAIGIGPVKIPEYLNQPEIVTRITPNEVRVDEFAKWAEPLEENISRALAENLHSLLCIRAMAAFPWNGRIPIDYRIDVQVIHMDGMLGESAVLDVSWAIASGADRKKSPLFSKRKSYREPTGGGGHEAFVSAQSRNLASLSREIAETILAMQK